MDRDGYTRYPADARKHWIFVRFGRGEATEEQHPGVSCLF